MLKVLKFHNLGLLEHAEVSFSPGLTALTGESGAGKSLVLSGLALLAGSHRSRLGPRAGRAGGFVEGEFDIGGDEHAELRAVLTREGLDDGNQLVLARRVQENGRTRAFVQGQQVTRSLLETLGGFLFEFCDQGQSHGLRTPQAQLEALDDFLSLGARRAALRAHYDQLLHLGAERDALLASQGDNERRLEFVEFQLEELEQCAHGDFLALEAKLHEMQRNESADELLENCQNELGLGPQSVVGRLRYVQRLLEGARLLEGPTQEELCQKVGSLLDGAEELEQSCRSLRLGLPSTTPDGKREVEQAVDKILRVAQKHRLAPIALGEKQATLRALRDELKAAAHRLLLLEKKVSHLSQVTQQLAAELHDLRVEGARRFDSRATAELGSLGLEAATLETHLARGDLGPSGISRISIGFSAHPGQGALPLGRIASGGEMARVLLGMRLALGRRSQLLCFDEIDAGSGGEIATKIGEALKRASAGGQVLCVTHWPQVAGLADTHLLVDKSSAKGEPLSHVQVLTEEGRLRELTRMLGGRKETAHKHAQQLRLTAA